MSYDLIIVGGGPAGLTAAIYASRYKMKTLVLSKDPGGMAATAHKVCNYPGYESVNGMELMQKFEEQAKKLGAEVKYEEVKKMEKKEDVFLIKTSFDNEFKGKKLILAVGTVRRSLGLEREEELIGKGVSYCATCDAAFFKDKKVGVVGGGNSALTAALLLSEYAKKVYIIYRRDKFYRAEPAWVKQVENNDKIETIFEANVVELVGQDKLEKVELDNNKELDVGGLFIEIGSVPSHYLTKQLGVKTDEKGYIKVDEEQRTNVEGVFAAGDATDGVLKQIVTAAGQGATAAFMVYEDV